jgi:hypothetical protein
MYPPVDGFFRIRKTLLADDGVVDPVAVDIAVTGARPVQVTETERLIAAALLFDGGATVALVAWRLRMSSETARRLADEFRAGAEAGTAAAAAQPESLKEVA